MIRRTRAILAVVAAVALLLGGTLAPAAAAPPGSGSATIIVDFATPEGVPAMAAVQGDQGMAFATKGALGAAGSVTLSVASGKYSVEPHAVMAGTLRYVGVPSPRNVQVQPGSTQRVTVTYQLSQGVQEAHVADLGPTHLALSWKAPEGTSVQVRRTEGEIPARSPSEGVAVAATAAGLSDSGLKPGTQYNYSLWARPGDSAHGVEQRNGPLVISVGTQDPSDALKPTYVVKPGTFFPLATDISAAMATGSGVQVRLAEGVQPPVPGAAMVLPMSESLRGGFLGIVTGVSHDGRTIDLEAGGLGDAFDFFHLKVDDLSALPVVVIEEAIDNGAAPAQETAPTQNALAGSSTKEDQHRAQRETTHKSSAVSSVQAVDPEASCGNFSSTTTAVDFQAGFDIEGHFETTLSTYSVLFVDVPVGVSLDAGTAVTVSGALSARAAATLACQVKLPSLMIPLTAAPVPISYYLKPTIKVGVEGAIQVSNVGLAQTFGYSVDGYIGFAGDNHFTSEIINEAVPLTPQIDAVSGGVTAKLSLETLVGPGAGTSAAGVIIGLGGEITPLDARANVTVPTVAGGSPCLTLTAKFEMGIIASARAWLGPVDFKADLPIPGLHLSEDYPFTPWYWPTDCTTIPDPSDDVLGDGVTMIDDEVTGSPEQWGYLDGFAPGAKAWVLSSGLVAEAQGSPDFFASTGLGNPGDTQLTEYAGFPTYDSAAYQVTLVPTGSTLKVKYAFASEEYPEYVGSNFNDVMAIFVNGQNCALVPGSNTPVSINTINQNVNAEFYVDNTSGASGYNTSYDGITTPLECRVPVEPGVPVTVRVAVADASDSIYDSGIALVDNGISSE